MQKFKKVILLINASIFIIILQSCGIAGIHFQVHNPGKQGKMPEFTEEIVLLGQLNKFRSCYDVHYYDLSLNIDQKTKSLDGIVEIHAVAKNNFDTLQLDLHQNFTIIELSSMNPSGKLTFRRKERAIYIYYPQKKGANFSLTVQYQGKPVKAKKPPWIGGFVWKEKKGKPWTGVACESDGASIWWPLKDHTNDEPDSMRMHYTVPEGLIAVGNGQLENTETKNGKNTFHWYVSYPINTYNVTLYIGNFHQINETYTTINGNKVSLQYFVLEKNIKKAQEHFKQVKPILDVYEQKFGEYPWVKDGFKLIESPYAGMEHQTAIAYGNGYKNNFNNTDYIILHEVAHEWWGNSVSAADMAHVWIQEGFATYSEALYYEEEIDKTAYENILLLYKWFIKNKYPVVGVSDRRWFHYKKSSDVYVKGAWILHSLRTQINNEDMFFDIIKTFYQKYEYKTVTTDQFIEIVNEKTKTDYNWFFNHYLYKNEAPELEYAISEEGVLYYRWNNTSPEFDKLKITITNKGKDITLIPSDRIQTHQLEREFNGKYKFVFKQDVLFANKENDKLLWY